MSQSLTKALILLKHLANMPKGAGVRELARLAGYTPSTVHSLLKALQAQGFVDYDQLSRHYRLGLVMALLGSTVDRVAALRMAVEPILVELFTQLGESATAVAWMDGRALVVCRRQSKHQLVTVLPDGEVAQPHLWASGQVLLAFQTTAVAEAYIAGEQPYRLHPLPEAEAAELRANLATVRQQGYSEAIDVGGSGVGALAVPVADALGQVRLTLAVSAPLSRFAAETRQVALAALQAAAVRIAPTLGAVA